MSFVRIYGRFHSVSLKHDGTDKTDGTANRYCANDWLFWGQVFWHFCNTNHYVIVFPNKSNMGDELR